MSRKYLFTENIWVEIARLLAYPFVKKSLKKLATAVDEDPEVNKAVTSYRSAFDKMAEILAKKCHEDPHHPACKEFWKDPDFYYKRSKHEKYRKMASDYKPE